MVVVSIKSCATSRANWKLHQLHERQLIKVILEISLVMVGPESIGLNRGGSNRGNSAGEIGRLERESLVR